jgi:hypothetical protein
MNRPAQLLLFVVTLTVGRAASVVEKHPQKDFIFQSLQRLVDECSKASENHFFVLRKKDGKDWIYWREGRLLWDTDLAPYYENKGPAEIRARAVWDLRLHTPRKPIDLDTDAVPAGTDVGGSTYLVTKDLVADIVYECVLDGEMLTLQKKEPNQSPQRNAGSRPTSADSHASETPFSLRPRG